MAFDFTKLWSDFSEPLKKFISKRISNENDVEDVLQEVSLKVYKSIDDLKDIERITSWIYTIARNAVIDYYRKHSNHSQSAQIPENLINEETDDVSANKEIASCLTAMINVLPEKYKEAILLTEFENYTQKELSEKIGLSLSGAKSRVQRARKQLKEILIGCCQIDVDHFGNVVDYKHKAEDCKFC